MIERSYVSVLTIAPRNSFSKRFICPTVKSPDFAHSVLKTSSSSPSSFKNLLATICRKHGWNDNYCYDPKIGDNSFDWLLIHAILPETLETARKARLCGDTRDCSLSDAPDREAPARASTAIRKRFSISCQPPRRPGAPMLGRSSPRWRVPQRILDQIEIEISPCIQTAHYQITISLLLIFLFVILFNKHLNIQMSHTEKCLNIYISSSLFVKFVLKWKKKKITIKFKYNLII